MTSRHHIFFILLLVLVVIDVVTTTYGLEFNIITEGNPLVAGIVTYPVLHLLVKVSFAAMVAGIAMFASNLWQKRWTTSAIYLPNIGLYSVIVANNLYWLFLV